jgi:signal transduction histidine kinase
VSGPEPFVAAAFALPLAVAFGLARRTWRLERRFRLLAPPLHELRGAMSALALGLALIERESSLRRLDAGSEALRTQLGRAGAAIEELDHLRGPGRPREEPRQVVDLASLVRRRARAWSQLAPAYGARLRLSWGAGAVALLSDRSRLEQALDNLIANALEHGGGRVVVEGTRRGATVRISIWDSGTGLASPPDQLAEAPVSSRRGHGVAIARAAIEWHGGRLGSVRRDGGAAIEIDLPIEGAAKDVGSLRTNANRREGEIASTVARTA